MKKMFAALLAALTLLYGGCMGARAQAQLSLYVSCGALSADTARQLAALLQRALGDVEVELILEEGDGVSLRSLVLADCAPNLAVCSPQEAANWARAGLLIPLEGDAWDLDRMAQPVVDACMISGTLYMAPLRANHRRMAVHDAQFEKAQLSYLLNEENYPVWLPMQLMQALDEFALMGKTAMELWPAAPGESGALEALVQTLYGGVFLGGEAEEWTADSDAAISALEWLSVMVDGGLIGMAHSREEALERFLAGETALFADWTQAEEARIRAQGMGGVTTLYYPAASGMVMHAFDLSCAAVFCSDDPQNDALALRAADFLMQDIQAQLLLGHRGIWEDGAVWLPCLGTDVRSGILRSALMGMANRVLEGELEAEAALDAVQAAAEAAGEAAAPAISGKNLEKNQ